jgi:peptidoglycan/xylan/chitin deacetylase (PgdA/CDA1 family)
VPPRRSRPVALGGATAGAAAGLLAAAYAAPSIARLLPPRLRLTPRLSGLGDPSHLALTFDDGPDPASTPAVLAQLDRLGWKATFFCLGTMTEAAPGLAAELVAAGHEVGVHGYEHAGAIRRTPRALTDDVARTRDLVADATGTEPFWYRPPFGELSAGSLLAARAAGLRLVLWSAWCRDWRAEATPASVVADLDRGVLRGGTALLHDSDCTSAASAWRTTVAALPLLAEHLEAMGLGVGPLREHGLRGPPAAA